MDLLRARIKAFNKTMDHIFKDMDCISEYPDWKSFYKIKQMETANAEQLNKLQSFFDTEIPSELMAFYQQLGGLENYAADNFSLQIPSVPELLEQQSAEKKYKKRYSMGLIDGIKHSWSNERPEFDDVMPKSEIDYINTNYNCIGLYRFDGILDEAFYIYFDKDHRFGLVRYHQDEFDELWDEHLTFMLTESQAKMTLKELLIQILDHLEEGIIADEEENSSYKGWND